MSRAVKVLGGAAVAAAALSMGAAGAAAQGTVTDVDDHGHAYKVYGECTPSARYTPAAGSVTFAAAEGCERTVVMGWQAWERHEGRAFEDQTLRSAALAVVAPGRSVTVSVELPCGAWLQLDAVAVRDGKTQPSIVEHSQGAYAGGATVRTAPCVSAPAAPAAPAAPEVPAVPAAPMLPITGAAHAGLAAAGAALVGLGAALALVGRRIAGRL